MNLQGLTICRNLLDDVIFNQSADKFDIAAKLIENAENFGISGNLHKNYLIYKLANEANLVSETVEKNGGIIGKSLREIFIRDIGILLPIFLEENFITDLLPIDDYEPTLQKKSESRIELEKNLSGLTNAEKIADVFINFYKKFGYGDIAACRAFRWDSEKNELVGIKNFSAMKLDDLIGYAHQKELLTKNTKAFLEKKPANNVLLVGARGTGKSSGVKALVNEYYHQSLRLVQITNTQLKEIPKIMENLRKFASRKFIIFLDDLSFDENESDYKILKSAIEGGIIPKPENVLIYATSNRRHLIREKDFEDRYNDDTINETISLSDRFGLIIHYYPPTQEEYLEIIRCMLKKKGIELDGENLRIEGLRWEMSHSGRNGRTAQQFVNYFLGQK